MPRAPRSEGVRGFFIYFFLYCFLFLNFFKNWRGSHIIWHSRARASPVTDSWQQPRIMDMDLTIWMHHIFSSSSSSIVNDNIKILMTPSYLWSQLQANCIADLTRKAAGVYCVSASVYCITSLIPLPPRPPTPPPPPPTIPPPPPYPPAPAPPRD